MVANMKWHAVFAAWLLGAVCCPATMLGVVQVYEPLSLHDTDGDDVISELGEALKATVAPRPMALSKALPEALITNIRTPHRIPSDDPNYKVAEANLLVLCNIGIQCELTSPNQLTVKLDISQLAIPAEVDLTSRQLLKLAILSVRKTLEAYQQGQQRNQTLEVNLEIAGADGNKAPLRDLNVKLSISGGRDER